MLLILNIGMLDLHRRNQLPDRERAVCVKLLLRVTLKDEIFDELERSQVGEWLSVVEGKFCLLVFHSWSIICHSSRSGMLY